MPTYPYEVPALQVDQPMGTYYVALLPAALLLDVCFSDRLRAYKEEDGPYRLAGTQRGIDEKRLKAIGSFVSPRRCSVSQRGDPRDEQTTR